MLNIRLACCYRRVIVDLYGHEYNDLRHYLTSYWFDVCRNAFDVFGKRLCLDDVMAEDKVIQTQGSPDINKANPFINCRILY